MGNELPQALQYKASISSLDFWVIAQDRASRLVEDGQRGREMRVADAEAQTSDALREIDNVEARAQNHVETISTKSAAFDVSESSKQAASEPAVQAEARVAVLEAEIRFRDDYAVRRDLELALACDSINRMAAAIQGFRNRGAAN